MALSLSCADLLQSAPSSQPNVDRHGETGKLDTSLHVSLMERFSSTLNVTKTQLITKAFLQAAQFSVL